jgi:signal peptidase I
MRAHHEADPSERTSRQSVTMSAAALRPERFLPRGARSIAVAACVGLMAGAAVRTFSFYPLRVTSSSMSPAVAKGDWVVISPRRADATEAVHRGDIVLFRFPFGGSGRAIKRVVAVAGDRVEIEGDEIRVHREKTRAPSARETMVIPDGYYFVLGDNRASSVDSRSLGLLSGAELLGTVAAVIKQPW